MLTQNLRRLERDGLVNRKVYAEVPPRVEYSLTPMGETLCVPLRMLRNWAEENLDSIQAAQRRYDEVIALKQAELQDASVDTMQNEG